MKLITKEIEEKFKKYPIGSQDGLGGKAKVIVKFFNPIGRGTWFITEGNKLENGDYEMFGYCHLGDDEMAEFGYVMLSELEDLKLPFGLKIERDLYMPKECELIQAMKSTGITPPDYMLEEYSTTYEKVSKKTMEYFKENDIKDLMNYGADSDEGLYHLTTMYSEILNYLDVEFDDIYTEDGISDGKYLTTITFKNNSQIEIDTRAWNDAETVTDNVSSILEEYEKLISKELENKNNEDIEIDI